MNGDYYSSTTSRTTSILGSANLVISSIVRSEVKSLTIYRELVINWNGFSALYTIYESKQIIKCDAKSNPIYPLRSF